MTFEVDVDGRVFAVSVEPLDRNGRPGFRVLVDGRPHEVGLVPTELGMSLTFDSGRVVDAAVTLEKAGDWLIQFPRATARATVDARRHASSTRDAASLTGAQRITAPMPGRVVRVLVREGDEVAAGQGVVVVEAMKMENELASPKAGRIKEVAVAEGASVEAGKVLAVVE